MVKEGQIYRPRWWCSGLFVPSQDGEVISINESEVHEGQMYSVDLKLEDGKQVEIVPLGYHARRSKLTGYKLIKDVD